jgi:protoheme IX farnesyltransferase
MGAVCFDRALVAPQLVPQLALALPLAILGITPLIRRKLVHAWFSWPVTAALIMLAGQIAIAGGVNAGWIRHSTWLPPLHLLLSLNILGLLLIPTTLSFYPDERLSLQTFPAAWRAAARTLSGRLSWLTLGAVFVSLVSGALVSGDASLAACPAWPFCASSFWPADAGGWLNLFHRASVGVSGLLLAAFLWDAWRARRAATAPLVAASAAGVLFGAQSLVGAVLLREGAPLDMQGLHQATAAGAWAALVVALVANGMAHLEFERGALKPSAGFWRPGLLKDYLALTKPIVVVLLLVTTYAGMVIGARAWPSLRLAFFTLLGGALAAGGCGAINQFIDRRDDARMQRTEHRPLPSGRLEPGEALAFGVSACLAALYLTIVFVNWLTALLILGGICYYALVYSLLLKKTTVQNIVIGGGAGAVPPMVGWAAATHSLALPAALLFILVFLWTPPHFWALAIVRRKDYARAGVPMLPVVRGLAHTRKQIWFYSLGLVAFTLLLPVLGLGRLPYLAGAVILGGGLLGAAWKVWREGGNKHAWKMYRYSSLYLAGVFLALMIDALI